MSTQGQVDVARRFFDAFEAGDIGAMIAAMHPEIVWEVPGRSPVAGRFVGLDAVGSMMLGISAMAGGTEHVRAVELFGNDDGVVALVEVDIATGRDAPWHGEDAWLVRTDGTQVTHVREHWFDTRGFDELTAWDGVASDVP